MKEHPLQLRDLRVTQVQRDMNQPRKDLEVNINRLLESIKKTGLQQPIIVRAMDEAGEMYQIIDGHRRFVCATKLGFKTVPCIVHGSELKDGELQRIRYEVQNNRMAWKPMERAEAFASIKNANHFKTNRDVGQFLGLSESTVANALQLIKVSFTIRDKMAEYKLKESYRVQLVRMLQKIRKISDFEPDQIIDVLLKKMQSKVIKNSKDLRKLGKIFLRASANEKEIYKFLTHDDMTIEDLEVITVHTGSSLLLEKIIASIAGNLQHKVRLQEQEEKLLLRLGELIEKYKSTKPAQGA